MDRKKKLLLISLFAGLLFTGCGGDSQPPQPAKNQWSDISQLPEVYSSFLSGDISMFSADEVEKWGISSWTDTILPAGGLEYTCLDLNGDGVPELLVQYQGEPWVYNSVFSMQGSGMTCWENDMVDGTNWSVPLQDGSMLYQSNFNGTRSYTVFRYEENGIAKEVQQLFARDEKIPETSTEPCPFYAVNGTEVAADIFEKELQTLQNKILESTAWVQIPPSPPAQ